MSWPHLLSRQRRTELTTVCSVGWMVEGVIDNIILYIISYIYIILSHLGLRAGMYMCSTYQMCKA